MSDRYVECKECSGTGLGDYPNSCWSCHGNGFVQTYEDTRDKVAVWVERVSKDTKTLKEKIDIIEQEKNALQVGVVALQNEITKMEDVFIVNWVKTLSSEDQNKVNRLLEQGKRPTIKVNNSEVIIKWDGFTLDELDVKDVIE